MTFGQSIWKKVDMFWILVLTLPLKKANCNNSRTGTVVSIIYDDESGSQYEMPTHIVLKLDESSI